MTLTFFLSTFVRPICYFKQPTRASKSQNAQQNQPLQQPHLKEPYEIALEALQRSLDHVMEKLDRIEAKLELLTDTNKLPAQDSYWAGPFCQAKAHSDDNDSAC